MFDPEASAALMACIETHCGIIGCTPVHAFPLAASSCCEFFHAAVILLVQTCQWQAFVCSPARILGSLTCDPGSNWPYGHGATPLHSCWHLTCGTCHSRALAHTHSLSPANTHSLTHGLTHAHALLLPLHTHTAHTYAQVYDLDTKVEKVMDMMGFLPRDGAAPVSSFSGGWRMRIGLGKILLRDPNVLLLDEPTNHLDLESVEWLENFLQNQNLPMVIVSHDREFLDRVCTRVSLAQARRYCRVSCTHDGEAQRWQRCRACAQCCCGNHTAVGAADS
jgi:ABC transporter